MTTQRARGAQHRYDWRVLGTVASYSESEKEYELTQHKTTGQLHCPCMGYVFNKDNPKTCKHIKAYMQGGWAYVAAKTPAKPRTVHTPTVVVDAPVTVGSETYTFKRQFVFDD